VVREHEIVAFKKLKPRGGFRLPVWQDGLNHLLLLCRRSPLFDVIADRAFGLSATRPSTPLRLQRPRARHAAARSPRGRAPALRKPLIMVRENIASASTDLVGIKPNRKSENLHEVSVS
jgi:hypothetical protein